MGLRPPPERHSHQLLESDNTTSRRRHALNKRVDHQPFITEEGDGPPRHKERKPPTPKRKNLPLRRRIPHTRQEKDIDPPPHHVEIHPQHRRRTTHTKGGWTTPPPLLAGKPTSSQGTTPNSRRGMSPIPNHTMVNIPCFDCKIPYRSPFQQDEEITNLP